MAIAQGQSDRNQTACMSRHEDFARRLRQGIAQSEHAGTAQYQLAKLIGVSPPTLSNWLTGKKLPSMETATKIAVVLDCSVDWLLQGNPGSEGMFSRRTHTQAHELLHLWSALPPQAQQQLIDIARVMAAPYLREDKPRPRPRSATS